MAIGAVLAAFVAVLVGTLQLADLAGPEVPRRMLGGHVGLALVALIVIGAGAAVASAPIAWAGVAALVATIAAGVSAWRKTPPEVRPSNAMLITHGAAAAVTLILAVGAAITA